ncbi:glycosyltransferase [Pseudenterobacter timonensis]|uniref:Glycosyltransferase n=1 Tax=Pseudenterobacter timonensis TaxID=1755099 RepID=A0ABV4A4Q1_9ENTR
MKIAVVYHYFAHYREPVLSELIKKSKENGDEIKFIADNISNEPNLKLYNFDGYKENVQLVKNIWVKKFLWQKGLISYLFKYSPDTIVFLGQFNFLSTWIASIFFRVLGKRILFWGHGVYGSETGLKKLVRDCFNRLPHVYMTYGEYARNLMLKRSGNVNIRAIYNSLNVREQNILYKKLASSKENQRDDYVFDKNRTNLIFVGRLTSVKKINLIIEAINKLNSKNYNLLIVGSGPEEMALRKLVSNFGLEENVTFMGAIHDEIKLSWLIYNSDICVSPGNVGLTAMHALVYGTPVITNDDFSHQMPEFESIQDNINGSFFKVNDIDSLAEKIELWRRKIISNGRDDIRVFCREPILKKFNPENQAQLIYMEVMRDDTFYKKK